MRVLYLCHRTPFPPDKGEKIRAFQQLRALAAGHNQVDLFTLDDSPSDLQGQSELLRYCRQVTVVPLNRQWKKVSSLLYLPTDRPLTLPYFYSAMLARKIREALASRSYDRIFVFCSSMFQYVESVEDIPILLDLQDVDSDKWFQYADYCRFPHSWIYRREGETLRNYERWICEKASLVTVLTEREARVLRSITTKANIEIVPNGVDTQYFSPRNGARAASPPTMVFTGAMDYFPNVEAVRFFALSVFPAVRQSFPEARFVIVGGRPSPKVRALERIPGVTVTGRVPDIRPYLDQAHLFVAPLRLATGIQNKILEALAMALPVLAMPRPVQGISPKVASYIDVAESPDEWIRKTLDHLTHRETVTVKAVEARSKLVTEYDWGSSLSRLLSLLASEQVVVGNSYAACG